MKTISSNSETKIYGDHSPHPVIVNNDVVNRLGGPEATFHEIHRLEAANLLPRIGSASKPLTMKALDYAYENERLGYRHWQWKNIITGHSFQYGYGYFEGDKFIFVD